MNRFLASLLCVVCCLVPSSDLHASAQSRRSTENKKGPIHKVDEVATLRAVYSKLLEASRAKDEGALTTVLDENYSQTLADGSVRTRQERIADTVSPDQVVTALELVSFRGAVHGNRATGTAEVVQRGTYKGEAFDSRVRSKIEFARKQGVWRIVSTRLAPVSDADANAAPN